MSLTMDLHQAHIARTRRIAEAAERCAPKPNTTRPYEPSWSRSAPVLETEPETVAEWAERQKQIPLPPMKEPWFHIVAEIEPKVSIERIQRIVAERFGFHRRDLLSERRSADVVLPRQVAMYLAKKMTLRSLPKIGRHFGGRDHTTVMHGIRKTETLIQKDSALAQLIDELKSAIEASYAIERTDCTHEEGISGSASQIEQADAEASRACDADAQAVKA